MAGELLYTYESEKAVVRIYSGQRTAEERKTALEESAKRFYREIQKQKQKKEVKA